MNRIFLSAFSLFIFLFFVALSKARAQSYNFHLYSIEHGIPQSQVHCVIQDKKGFIWFGTDGGGLVRYDGKKFTAFTTSEGLCNDGVYALAEDAEGKLWIGTPKGICVFQVSKFIALPSAFDTLSGEFIRSIRIGRNSEILFGTGRGAFVYDGKAMHAIEPLNGKAVFSIYEDEKGNCWFGTNEGIFVMKDDSVLKTFNPESGLKSNTVSAFLEVKDKMYVATSRGVNIIQNDSVTSLSLPAPPAAKQITQFIFRDKENDLWICTLDAGVYRFSKDTVTRYGTNEGLTVEGVWGMMQDNEGNFWFGTDGAGAAKLGKNIFTSLQKKNGLLSEMILSMHKTKKGEWWFGHDNGATYFNGKDFSFYGLKSGFASEKVWHIAEDNTGSIWLTTYGSGIFKYANGKFTNYSEKNGLSNNNVRTIFHDSKKRIWIGTANGLNLFDPAGNTFKVYGKQDGLASQRFLCIFEDSKNNLWFGTSDGGVAMLNESGEKFSFRNFTEANGLAGRGSLCLAEDKDGNIWSASFDGISRINPATGEIKKITKKDGLASNTVYAIAVTDDNYLLIGTNSGIDKLDVSEYNRNAKVVTRHFGPAEGFFGTECNTSSVLKDDDGRIWFGTIRGAFAYHPKEDKLNTIPPKTELTGLRLFFEKADFTEYSDTTQQAGFLPADLSLPYHKNHLTFDFAGLSFSIPGKVQYKYMLDGFDKNWIGPVKESFATYSNIPPGSFTFKVMSCNNDGVWGDPAEYFFTITPPFWATWWFRIGALCVIIIGIYGIFKWRLSRLRALQKYLQEQVDLKTKELRAEKETVEAQNKIIEKKNQNITASIRYAKRIQDSILPMKEKISEVVNDSFIFFQPKDIVSGDFYWFGKVNGISLVAAVDCTGHGVPGAFMSLIGNNLLNDIVLSRKITDPQIVLHQLHEGVVGALKKHEHESGTVDGMDIALCAVDFKNKVLEFASSGRPLILVNKTGLRNFSARKHPVGLITHKEVKFEKKTIHLGEQDTFYIFTDGYCDQFGGPENDKFMEVQFENLLRELNGIPMAEQKKAIEDKINDWKKSNPQIDDMLVIGVRC